jgi:hypothetical protein
MKADALRRLTGAPEKRSATTMTLVSCRRTQAAHLAVEFP